MQYATELIEAVKQEMKAGLTSPEIIAIRLGQSIVEVEGIMQEFESVALNARSNVEIMRDNLQVIQGLMDTAEWTYRGDPSVEHASALTQMVQTSLAAIKEIEARKDPALIMNEILGRIIQPMIREFIKQTTIAANQARAELFETTPRENHPKIDAALKGLVKGIGRASSTDYKKTVGLLASILECKPEDEKVRPIPRVVRDGDDDEQKDEGAASS